MNEPTKIYVATITYRVEGEWQSDVGMVTLDKDKAQAWATKHEGYIVHEVEDGDEWPSVF